MRLDAFLADRLAKETAPEPFTRARVQRLVKEGLATLDGARAKSSERMTPGAVAEVEVPAPRATALEPQDIPLDVLHEDDDLIVIDKPAGLAAHAGAGLDGGTLVNALLARVKTLPSIGDAQRPGIVHRLDKDTTGVLVAAKSDLAHLSLSKQFHDHTVERRYHALVWGTPPAALTIDARLARDPKERKRFTVVKSGGRTAITHLRSLERFAHAALVECKLETGRTHQIRVHLSARGFPVIGDPVYGGRRVPPPVRGRAREMASALSRQMLHAATLAFTHPRSEKRLSFEAPMPRAMAEMLAAFRGSA